MENHYQLTLTAAKNKCLVPVVNGIHLHSQINPIKEAEAFANNYMAQVNRNQYALILGFGFGYHIDELLKIMSLTCRQPQIVVIEAIKEVYRATTSQRKFPASVRIIHHQDPEKIYSSHDFLFFITHKPTVILHPASFQLASTYYRKFLTRKPSEERLKENLTNLFGKNRNIHHLAQQIGTVL